MNKILRLSLFNIKKHKIESVCLVILIMFCMLLLGSSLSGGISIKNIFPDVMNSTGSMENYVIIQNKNYDDQFIDILNEDERVTISANVSVVYDMSTCYLDSQGEEQPLSMCFITKENQAKMSHYEPVSSLSHEEIETLAHPVYMPFAAKDSLHMNEGEKFDLICGKRKFSFDIAGFYEETFLCSTDLALKMIVSDNDYNTLTGVLDKYEMIGFDTVNASDTYDVMYDFLDNCENYAGKDIKNGSMGAPKEYIESNATFTINILLNIMKVMAVIIIISVAVMIRFRITDDIQEQIVSIGVLEVLGYTSGQIALSYVVEYLLITMAGIIIAAAGCLVLIPVLFHLGEIMSGHHSTLRYNFMPVVLTAAGLLVFVSSVTCIKTLVIKKYPPVKAFRGGIDDNHFGKKYLSLKNTKRNVHLRIAIKNVFSNPKQNLGLILCITLSSASIVSSFIVYDFLADEKNIVMSVTGLEMSDIDMHLTASADAEELADELIEEYPEIRKILPTNSDIVVTYPEKNSNMYPIVYSDYNQTEYIFPAEGRFPEHDNEVMISKLMSGNYKIKVGDTVTLAKGKIERQYIVTGLVTSVANSGANLYITEGGYKRFDPAYRPLLLEIYLNDGVDADDFKSKLTHRYGRSISDVMQDGDKTGTYEEKIKYEADEKIAELMAAYGVSHIEYAIKSGDTMITGDSSAFKVRHLINKGDYIKNQISGICSAIHIFTRLFMAISAAVVMIIIFILMESSVRKQRKDLGILKGMGYTSKELMFQLAFRIMPAAFISVAAATALSVLGTNLLTSLIGKVSVDLPSVIILDIVFLIFCFLCAYISAGKIKKISVYQLITE
ncbi:MAG: ABC transporter permease [Oscillospiraceae bacterium]|nr:ABC transporter permease [Oscillospiraceae bacterium]